METRRWPLVPERRGEAACKRSILPRYVYPPAASYAAMMPLQGQPAGSKCVLAVARTIGELTRSTKGGRVYPVVGRCVRACRVATTPFGPSGRLWWSYCFCVNQKQEGEMGCVLVLHDTQLGRELTEVTLALTTYSSHSNYRSTPSPAFTQGERSCSSSIGTTTARRH